MKYAIFSDVHGNLGVARSRARARAEQNDRFPPVPGRRDRLRRQSQRVCRPRALAAHVACLQGQPRRRRGRRARARVLPRSGARRASTSARCASRPRTPSSCGRCRTSTATTRASWPCTRRRTGPRTGSTCWTSSAPSARSKPWRPHRVAFIGHSHSPVVFVDDGTVQRFPSDGPLMLDLATRRYVINVGSVGQPRDGNPDASYVVFDDETDTARPTACATTARRRPRRSCARACRRCSAERLLIGY